MKKLLCLLMAMFVLFSFAACGESEGSADKDAASKDNGSVVSDKNDNSTNSDSTVATSIKFDAESYTIGIGDDIKLIDHVTVEPAGAAVEFSCSDESIAVMYSKSTGDIGGEASGEVTITVTSGDVSATCKLVVAGFGTIVARDKNVGGITNKRWGAVERPDDPDAYVIIVPKNLSGADMSKAVNYVETAGEKLSDGSCAVAVNGYYVAKSGDTGNYTLNDVPEGEYVGIIISSMDYTSKKGYDKAEAIATFKASPMAKYFTDAEINSFVGNFYNREFYVGEFTVTANTNNVFGYDFEPDLHM